MRNMPRRLLTTAVFVAGLFSFSLKPAFPFSSVDMPLYKEGELLVQMKTGTPEDAAKEVHSALGTTIVKDLGKGIKLVRLPQQMSVKEGIRQYRKEPAVLAVSPNYIRRANQRFPNDPYFSFLWGMHNAGQTGGTMDADIDAPEAWDSTTGAPNIVVAVLDSGVDYTHPDLSANMWQNPFDPLDGIDNDGNGLIDDIFGIDTVNDDADPMDDNGHGTHVAGIIGAVGDNSIGVAGANWDVKIMALKFLDSVGLGTTADEIEALNYLADMADRLLDYGRPEIIVAVNASCGGYLSADFSFERPAIDDLRKRGIIFVAAAGNDANDNDGFPFFPASYDLPNIIAVAATDDNDRPASFPPTPPLETGGTNFGRSTVHIGAPGDCIFSTFPGDAYEDMSGTSVAAAHVTGTVALLYSQFPPMHPKSNWPLCRNRVFAGGDLNEFLEGKLLTGRRLNAYGSLTCSDSELLARIRPATSEYVAWLDPASPTGTFFRKIPDRREITAIIGNAFTIPVKLSALHIDCQFPAGDVIVNIGGQDTILQDDGAPPFDLVRGDAVYSGQWDPPQAETDVTAIFPNIGTSSLESTDSFIIHVRKTDDPTGNVVADAGTDCVVCPGEAVNLDGSISSESGDASLLNYEWTQLSGSPVSLSGANTPFPTFTAPEVEAQVEFELTVADMDGNTDQDTVVVTVVSCMTQVNLLSPADGAFISSPPTFTWSADGGRNNIYAVDMALSLSGPRYSTWETLHIPITDTSWTMPAEIWNMIPSGIPIFWRIRGVDLAGEPLTIITSGEVWSFSKQ